MRTKILLLLPAVFLCGCVGPAVRSVPAGYMGKVLTPTGWEDHIHTAGQVDLRTPDGNGNFSVLILLEATSTTVKEQFLEANADSAKQDSTDHRVTTKDGAPLSVDVYIRAMLPDDESTATASSRWSRPYRTRRTIASAASAFRTSMSGSRR